MNALPAAKSTRRFIKPSARDENSSRLAPALNDDAHGWHHADDQFMATILSGSPRNKRMAAWKDNGLTQDNARNLVAYIKSLWSFRSLVCQGGRYIRCRH
jgi:mono/diheme cytochrome c family protein